MAFFQSSLRCSLMSSHLDGHVGETLLVYLLILQGDTVSQKFSFPPTLNSFSTPYSTVFPEPGCGSIVSMYPLELGPTMLCFDWL